MKLVGKSKTPSYTLTGLKDGKRYNVRVEATHQMEQKQVHR